MAQQNYETKSNIEGFDSHVHELEYTAAEILPS
jgi:hypothetical protein